MISCTVTVTRGSVVLNVECSNKQINEITSVASHCVFVSCECIADDRRLLGQLPIVMNIVNINEVVQYRVVNDLLLVFNIVIVSKLNFIAH